MLLRLRGTDVNALVQMHCFAWLLWLDIMIGVVACVWAGRDAFIKCALIILRDTSPSCVPSQINP